MRSRQPARRPAGPMPQPGLLAGRAIRLYLSRRVRLFASGEPTIEERPVLDIPSPCVGVCRLDPATGLCAGCMRTLDEIAAWPGASGAERLLIVQRLRARRRAAGRTSAADSRPRRRRRFEDAG